jgi:hypothetical protein
MNISSVEQKIQYILDENNNLAEILKSEVKPVEIPIKYNLKNAFEVFVLIDGTENYWISNYGRCVNNLNHKKKDKYYKHKEGDVHYTIFEIERKAVKNRRGRLTGEIEVYRHKHETSPKELVAKTFLKPYGGRKRIWNKDGDYSNNWYKNLVYVTDTDYRSLKAGKITWQSLNYEQEYIEYENKASYEAMKIYGSIKSRTINAENNKSIGKCYDYSSMCQLWLDYPKEFVKWYLEHYYEVEDESMAVDKDLFGNGSKVYSPETCCILPQGLNTMLANCKKHYFDDNTEDKMLPIGIRYSSKNNKYYGRIQFFRTEKQIKLSEWDTKEEAFAEYKIMKQADILLVTARYKESIPNYIYNELLKVEVKPY